jgi:hypothetical protein
MTDYYAQSLAPEGFAALLDLKPGSVPPYQQALR